MIEKAQAGDRTAFGRLVTAYQRRAYAVAYGFVGNREDALEMAQDSFVKAYKAIKRFDLRMPFYPWLYRIVKNTCLNHIKKRNRRGESSLDKMMASGRDFPSNRRGPDAKAIIVELRGAIRDALEKISDQHREIILLRHIHEKSYAEIAECLEIPHGTVMSRLHGARKSLRKVMEVAHAEVV
ncbi:MAG: sigma-70 family RNA polymerase sigma factor [Candidatus Hydrogenedentota bacterium]